MNENDGFEKFQILENTSYYEQFSTLGTQLSTHS